MLNEKEARTKAEETRTALKMANTVEITCETCTDNDNCEYAFDPYNTNGDCLAIK